MPLLENIESQGNKLFKYRGVIPIVVVGAALIIVYLTRHEKGFFKSNVYEVICVLISLMGFFIRIITVGFTPKDTSGRNTDGQLANSLNQTGMYSIVRHPLYLANFFMWLGLILLTGQFWFTVAIVLAYWIYYERIMFAEEQFLRNKYGQLYLNWASSTPTFIPKLLNWRNPDLKFNIRKVLRQEKNGFFALFLLFFLIEMVRNMDQPELFFRDEWYWTAGLMFGLLSYLVLKYLKYNSTILNDPQ